MSRKKSTTESIPQKASKAVPDTNTVVDGELETCPVCKSDKFLDPNLRLLVSPCYHRVCETCVERLFAHGSGPCPVCETTLRRSNWVVPTFEDLLVEKECRIRKRICQVFNKREEDFMTLKDYNDYLEEVEDLVFNLLHDVDVQKTNARLEAYRQQNLDSINKNRELMEREELQAQRMREAEEQQRIDYENQILAELEAEEVQRQQEEQRFIDELAAFSETRDRKKRVKRDAPTPVLVDTQMPSMKGLRSNVKQAAELPPIDPFETVGVMTYPEYTLDTGDTARILLILQGAKPLSIDTLKAGGYSLQHIISHSLLSAINY